MSAKPVECNWFLLFDIALSHGESLREQRLRHCGMVTLLRSAGLLGPKTGVYPFLIESLWRLHGRPSQPSGGSAADENNASLDDLTVDFDGFLAIMNVVCVRCYQTRRCTDLLNDQCPVLEAIRLSAEDQVHLRDGVVYTGRRFFKPLISRCTVLKKTVISLNSLKNNWTPYTNHLVIHVIAASADTIILPLFQRYAEEGRIYRDGFERMVKDVFPHFTPIQRISAFSVFDYPGFFGIHELMDHCILELPKLRIEALELDSFAEALLMLGIVAFSDEVKYEHHSSLTAKVWSVFEDYYSKFMNAPMIDDPVLNNKYATVLPTISLLFPSKVPLDKISSFIIGGWNLTVDSHFETMQDVGKDCPPRILQPGKIRKRSNDINKRRTSEPEPFSIGGLASKLFEDEINREIQPEYNLPLYGMRLCAVYVNETRAMACQQGPNRVEVLIPSSMWDISIHTTQIYFMETEEGGKLTLCPIKKASVSLRNATGNDVYSSRDFLFVGAPLVENIPMTEVRELRKIFDSHSTEGSMSFDEFSMACTELFISNLATQWGDCASFLKIYLKRRIVENSTNVESVDNEEDSIQFQDFVSAISTLFLYQLDASEYMPNIPYILGVLLARRNDTLPPLAGSRNSLKDILTLKPPTKSLCPYNARIDVPYVNALRRKTFSVDSILDVEETLKSVGKKKRSMRLLPEFPSGAKTLVAVSQYNDDTNGRQEKVKTASALLRKAFLKKEMVVCQQGLKME